MSKQTYAERAAAIRERAKDANKHKARKLYLNAQNTNEIYFEVIKRTICKLRRRLCDGKYSGDIALIAWKEAADGAAQLYVCFGYGGKGQRMQDVFSVADRCAVAVALAKSEAKHVFFGLKDQPRAPFGMCPGRIVPQKSKQQSKKGFFNMSKQTTTTAANFRRSGSGGDSADGRRSPEH